MAERASQVGIGTLSYRSFKSILTTGCDQTIGETIMQYDLDVYIDINTVIY